MPNEEIKIPENELLKKKLEEDQKRLNDSQKELENQKIAFLQDKLIAIGKDEEEVVRVITNTDALNRLITKRSDEVKKEKEQAAKVQSAKASIQNGKAVMPNVNGETLEIKEKTMITNTDPLNHLVPDRMIAIQFASVRANSRPALLYPDKDHPYPRFVG